MFAIANISYTRFIRTTDEDHKEAVKVMWEELAAKGFITKGKHEGYYSINEESFVPEKALVLIDK